MDVHRVWLDRWPQARKVLSFFAVGTLSAGLYAAACALLVLWLPTWKTAIMIAVYTALIPIAFFAQRRLTFRSSGPVLREMIEYGGLQIASVVVSTWLLGRFVTGDPLRNLAVFLLIAGLAAILSFAVCNSLIFLGGAEGRGRGGDHVGDARPRDTL